MSIHLTNKKGLLTICLNVHLPFTHFTSFNELFQERWLFETILECYLPMIATFHRLSVDKVPFKVLLSLSPMLITMLQDEVIQTKFIFYIRHRLEKAEQEVKRTTGTPYEAMAKHYLALLEQYDALYRMIGGDFVNCLTQAQEKGWVELITTGATSMFLPIYAQFPSAIKAQISTAVSFHKQQFGSRTQGFFVPYCAYYPGLDRVLQQQGLSYFITSGHSVLQGNPAPLNAIYAPVETSLGMVAFPRNRAVSDAFWRSKEGYAWHPSYRDFYRYDTNASHDVMSIDTYNILFMQQDEPYCEGFKYLAMATDANFKPSVYDFEKAMAQVSIHATEFIKDRLSEFSGARRSMDKVPHVLGVIDLELLGHRWFEGPWFIEELFRQLHLQDDIEMIHPSEYMHHFLNLQVVDPSFSSWGLEGYSQIWLDDSTDWLVRHLFKAVERMIELAMRFPHATGLKKRVLNQAAREVMLATAGDWPLLIWHKTNKELAVDQVRLHLANFYQIYEAMGRNTVRTDWLTTMERQNPVFQHRSFSYELFTMSELS
jgi:1,4-alpha-glucan branching enzyme